LAKAKQFIIPVEDRPGTAAGAIRALSDAKLNILSVLGWNPGGSLQVVTDNPRAAKKALDAAGVSYREGAAEIVELPNKAGTLLKHLDKLAKKGVNLRSICAATSKTAKTATVVVTAEE
jgi:hypothetical protein